MYRSRYLKKIRRRPRVVFETVDVPEVIPRRGKFTWKDMYSEHAEGARQNLGWEIANQKLSLENARAMAAAQQGQSASMNNLLGSIGGVFQ